MKIHTRQSGYITLIAVLILGAVGLGISTSVILLGLSTSQTSFVLEQSAQAEMLARACTEEALEQIRENTVFSGSGNLSFSTGSCSYTVSSAGGQNRIARSIGQTGTIVQKTYTSLDTINPQINITSWKQISDF